MLRTTEQIKSDAMSFTFNSRLFCQAYYNDRASLNRKHSEDRKMWEINGTLTSEHFQIFGKSDFPVSNELLHFLDNGLSVRSYQLIFFA